MITDLVLSMTDGGHPMRVARADGVVAALAAKARTSPWLLFEGAVASFDLDGEREFTITIERWRYIRDRAHGEVPDPGLAENVVELLWSSGIAQASTATQITRAGLFTEPTSTVRVRIADFVHEQTVPLIFGRREPMVALRLFYQICAAASRAFPPEVSIEDGGEAEHQRREYHREGPRVVATCGGCLVRETFTGAWGQHPSQIHEFARRAMAGSHTLCGMRAAQGGGGGGISRGSPFSGNARPVAP